MEWALSGSVGIMAIAFVVLILTIRSVPGELIAHAKNQAAAENERDRAIASLKLTELSVAQRDAQILVLADKLAKCEKDIEELTREAISHMPNDKLADYFDSVLQKATNRAAASTSTSDGGSTDASPVRNTR